MKNMYIYTTLLMIIIMGACLTFNKIDMVIFAGFTTVLSLLLEIIKELKCNNIANKR